MKKANTYLAFFFIAIACVANTLFGQSVPGSQQYKSGNIILGVTDTITSAILSETRVINISLPEGYSPDSSAMYPVIYLLDGGVDEDFIHIAGLVKYFTTPWIARFPKSIVVGIANVNRRRDFTFDTPNLDFVAALGFDKNLFSAHGGSGKFISFIENELQPFIKAHYKTNTSKTIIGELLGGLLAAEILLKKPSLFDSYIIVSPSLWWGKESLLKEPTLLQENSFINKLKIYVGTANKAEDSTMFNDAQALALKIKNLHKENLQVNFDYLPNETHATILHEAVYNALKLLYAGSK